MLESRRWLGGDHVAAGAQTAETGSDEMSARGQSVDERGCQAGRWAGERDCPGRLEHALSLARQALLEHVPEVDWNLLSVEGK